MPRATEVGRRRFLGMLAGAAAAVALPRGAPGRQQAPTGARRPNVLVIQPDQHRGMTLGCAGDEQAWTPNLDRLAAEGIRFSHAVSSSPLCAPFRGTMQTGLYWHTHGVTRNNRQLEPGLTGFAEIFAGNGYATGYIGKWHLDGTGSRLGFVPEGPRRQGWQEWNGYEKSHEYANVWRFDAGGTRIRVPGYDWEPRWQTDVTLDFARRHGEAGRPWLFYLAYGPPHNPRQCPERFLERFPSGDFELPPDIRVLPRAREREVRRLWQVYYGQVAAIDHEVGRILAGLDELGALDDTVVLYCSDHGDRLGSHALEIPGSGGAEFKMRGKASPHATAFRIPLLVRWPDAVPAGRVCDALVCGEDLAQTLLELAGLDAPSGVQGHSLAAACRGGDAPARTALYLGVGLRDADRGWRAIWDGRHVYSIGRYRVLYDHLEDPYELRNEVGRASHAELQRTLRARLTELARETGDPSDLSAYAAS